MTVDLIMYLTISVLTVLELVREMKNWTRQLFWNLFATLFTIALCLALRRVRQYSASFSNMDRSGRRRLLAHQISFVSASGLILIGFILFSLGEIVSSDTFKRFLHYASACAGMGSMISWFIVHCLMLIIYSR